MDKLRTEVMRERTASRGSLDEIRSQISSHRQQLVGLSDEISAARIVVDELVADRRLVEDVVKLQRDHMESVATVENRLRDLTALVDGFGFSLELILGPRGRYRTRLLTADDIDELTTAFDWIGDRDDLTTALVTAYRTLVELELRCIGRFAGSAQNIMAKLAAISMVSVPSAEVLEIGTLFGIGAVGIDRQLARSGTEAHLTIVDPLAGYQIQPDRGEHLDVSLSPATAHVVETNLALGGVPVERYRLVQGRSDDPHVRDVVGDRRYGLIVIDGDHSKEFALHDLDWAEDLAEPGALVVLDDFGDPAWPGVAEALDAYRDRAGAKLQFLGSAGTAAYLRMPPSDFA